MNPSRANVAVLAIVTLTLACQIGGNYIDFGGPQPPRLDLEAETVRNDLERQRLPLQNVEIKYASIIVGMAYGYKTDLPEESRYDTDVIAITKTMCGYDKGYSLRVIFSDGWFIDIDWPIV